MFLVKSLRQLRHTHSVMSSRGKSQFSLPSVLPPKERLIWVDCEMTGLDIETDKLLEIAVIVTEGDTLATVGMSSLLSPRLREVRSAISGCSHASSSQARLRASSSTVTTGAWTQWASGVSSSTAPAV